MAKMKNSGVKWIGEIPESWEIYSLKHLFQMFAGGDIDEDDFSDEYTEQTPYPIYSNSLENNGLFGYTSKYRFSGKTFTVTGRGDVGKAIVRNDKYYPIVRLLVCVPILKDDTRYFTYCVNSADLLGEQTAMAQLTTQKLGINKVPRPSIKEQQEIASFLDNKVKKIDKILNELRNQVDILNKYKKSLVTETVTRGLNPNAEMKDSGVDWIGMIPRNWEYRKLKYILKNNCNNLKVGPFGSALSGDDFKDEGYWVYNQRCVLDKNFDNTDAYVNEQKFNELIGFKVFPDDILITTRGTIGKVAIVPKNAKTGILHPCLIRFVVDNNLISNQLVELIFNESSIITEQIYRQSNATTIEVIYSYNLKELLLPIIPIEEQQQIVEYLEKKRREIDNLISNKQMQIEKMEKYKKSLIYEYVTGKKRVKGAEELYG